MRSMRICFVGDSMVNGAGDPDFLGWAGRICTAAHREGHDITSYNLGVRRDTSADIAARWHAEVSRRLPPAYDGRVVFSFGINDTVIEAGRPRVAFDDSLTNARHILGSAAERYPVLMVGPPPIAGAPENQAIARLSGALARVCEGLAVPYLDVYAPLAAAGTWVREATANDGAHPRAGGYAELASLVSAWPPWRSWLNGAR